MSQVMILSHTAAAGPAPEGKTTAQLNSGDGLVGTGPYRFVSFVPNDRMVVKANRNYWGTNPQWDTVTMRVIASSASRAASLLSGEIDAAQVPHESIAALRADQRVRVASADACHFTYLALDQSESSPTITGTDGKNPLRDVRVRKALSLAMNREAIAERVMSGMASPAAELGAPTLFGANPEARPDAFDAEAARKLIAEAGYPYGFGITLHTPNGLFPNDVQLAQAIAQMWARAGIRTQVDAVAGSVFYSRRNKLEYSAYVTNACPFTGQMSYSVRILAMTRDLDKGNGQINVSTYSNKTVDQLITDALRTIDDRGRAKLVQNASRLAIKEEFAVLPVILHKSAYATKANLQFRPRIDTFLTAMQVSPAK
jgi:peptide/nickel transport system substrate-binding protein